MVFVHHLCGLSDEAMLLHRFEKEERGTMQRVVVRKRRMTDGEILHFSLQDALPLGCLLALNTRIGTLSYLCSDGDRLLMRVQEQFSGTEMSLLLSLIDMFPYYCPYEVLHACFYHGCATDEVVGQSRRYLNQAIADGLWDQEMRPIRDALSRIRIKLRSFGLSITSLLATGYMLRMPA